MYVVVTAVPVPVPVVVAVVVTLNNSTFSCIDNSSNKYSQ